MIAIGKDSTNRTNEPIPESKNKVFNHPVPNLPMHQLYVLQPPPNKKMKVQFNAVIQKSLWKWEEGKSLVYIRFGHIMLGDWEFDIGPCILHRDAGGGFYTVRYDMSIDSDFIKSLRIGLPYKYTVYSPLIKVTKHQYECLHGAPPFECANTNRLLKVPKEKIVPGGFYRQFDTMILPDTKTKTTKGTVKKLFDLISLAEPNDPTASTIPTPAMMRCKCMEIHLQPTREILLSGSFKAKLDVSINGCVSLFRCVFLQWVEYRGDENRWEVPDIGSFLIDWIEALLVILNKQQSHAVTSAVLLACCLFKLNQIFNVPFSNEFRVALLQAMSLSITNGEKELEFLMSMIGESSEAKNFVIIVLVHYLRAVVKLQKPENAIVIVNALPLYHFLCYFSLPNQPTYISLHNITWGDAFLMIEMLKSTLKFITG
ncbi:PREDICTED: uncharacterized protein LOC109591649 [Amphimedon queenslandica]|nr:PREDICTED: uncharacterized protein LOC109591649 [Amphimedon queenslandica]|eukprot:XP_019862897.1 PREDICTED: uncharacterized protein LOC109591649 [Amphimedon queenslandica]